MARTRKPAPAKAAVPAPVEAEISDGSESDLTPPPEEMDSEADGGAGQMDTTEGRELEVEERPARNASPGLHFSLPLSWRAGRPPIPVAELLKRLQSLSTEMRGMEQIEDDKVRNTFAPVAKQLASEQLLGHKDKGVKAWVASCIVDVLRLCAPDAPFSAKEMKAVFEMMLKSILPALSDPSNAYNTQHMFVLSSLAQVKSIVLVTDLPTADSLILHLFTSFFDILSGSAKSSTGEQLAKAVAFNMTAILATLVDEMPHVPQDVVDTIMAQFLRVDSRIVGGASGKGKKGAAAVEDRQSTLEMKELPPAYTMAKTVCNTCSEKMAHEVSKYFSDVIMEATASSREKRRESDGAEGLDDSTIVGPSEEDLQELGKAHRLIRELWRACPAVLQNVIPQLEAELAAENVRLRLLATETLGDIVSGIGAAGPPPAPTMDPAAYPPPTLSRPADSTGSDNLLTVPAAPQSFPQAYPSTYTAFLGRGKDKSPLIRAARVTGIGRILATSAGGVGLSHTEQTYLVEELARVLNDSDERVRLAAVRAVAGLGFVGVVSKLGASGGNVDTPSSVLSNLSERVKDKKHTVREEAMTALANIWAAATGEIGGGNEHVREMVGGASSKILNAFYTNDPEIMALIDSVLFDILLPLRYPPIKSKEKVKAANGSSQRVKDSQAQSDDESPAAVDPDKIRAARILLLAKGLDQRAKKVFFSISGRQVSMSKYMMAYIKSCEEYNAGVMDKDEDAIKGRLTRLITEIAKFLPEPSKASSDLWKFAKMHVRRNYQLLRFCMAPDSDYRIVVNAIKEFKKNVETSSHPGLMETFKPLVYRSSILIYNKSHVPAIMSYSRTDEMGLSNIAHEVLTEISQRSPDVLKANVNEICMSLQDAAPTATKPNSIGAVDSLKACAAFARKFKDEIPQDAKFMKAMTSFTLYGSPPEAAKHAVSIIIASSNKKEMLAKDLAQKCIAGFGYGKPGFLAHLATLSRLILLAPAQIEDRAEELSKLVTKELLLKVRTPSKEAADAYSWSNDVDEECVAKCWALRILVNRIRSHSNASTLEEVSKPVYALLDKLISQEGELSDAKNTPPTHKSRLRQVAARCYLKLSLSKTHDALLTPQAFQNLALVAQDPIYQVRASFLQRLKKYLGRNALGPRFYTIPFLLVFEPDTAFKAETVTWLKSRAAFFAGYKTSVPAVSPAGATTADGAAAAAAAKANASKVSTTLEAVFPRLISMLAHHPDYGESPEELKDLVRYMIFYLNAVASETNVSLIFHVAQRVKACRDAVAATQEASPIKAKSAATAARLAKAAAEKAKGAGPDYSLRLHILSDLATMTLRSWIECHDWTLQSLPARLTLPRSLFSEIKDHSEALAIAGKNFIPDAESTGLLDDIDKLVRAAMRKHHGREGVDGAAGSRKRKSEGHHNTDGGHASAKRAKGAAVKAERREKKAPKKRAHDWDGSSDGEDDDDDDDDAADSDNAAGGRKENGRKRKQKTMGEESASRRKSARESAVNKRGIYRERDDSEDDEEMVDANGAAEANGKGDEDGDEDEEMGDAADEDEDEDGDDANEQEQEEESLPPRSRTKPSSSSTKKPTPSKITTKTPTSSSTTHTTHTSTKSSANHNKDNKSSTPSSSQAVNANASANGSQASATTPTRSSLRAGLAARAASAKEAKEVTTPGSHKGVSGSGRQSKLPERSSSTSTATRTTRATRARG